MKEVGVSEGLVPRRPPAGPPRTGKRRPEHSGGVPDSGGVQPLKDKSNGARPCQPGWSWCC